MLMSKFTFTFIPSAKLTTNNRHPHSTRVKIDKEPRTCQSKIGPWK